MITTKIIGNKITEARKKMNISQAKLAEQLFISAQAVGKWERGESMPDIITLNRLTEILHVDLNYFSDSFNNSKGMIQNEPIDKQSLGTTPKEFKKKLSWDMSRGNWVDADFSGLKNLHEKFSSSNMQKCLFIGSDLSRLILKRNNIEKCIFSESDISSSHIQSSNIANCIFQDCNLNNSEFSGSFVIGCDFTGANLIGTTFKSGGLQNNIMTNAILDQTILNGMHLVDLAFSGIIKDCYFENCDFKKVKFQNATITNTFFKGNNMKRIKFIDCQVDKLTYAFLKNGKADLNGVSMLDNIPIQ